MRRVAAALCVLASAGCGDKLFTYEVRHTPASGAAFEIEVDGEEFRPGTAFLIVRSYADYQTGQDEQVVFRSLSGATEVDSFAAIPRECGRLCTQEGCDEREVTLEQIHLSVQPDGSFALGEAVYCIVGGDVFTVP